jgi:hypothetical protein
MLKNHWKIREFYGVAFQLIDGVKKDELYKQEIVPIPGSEVLYVIRNELGKPIKE